MAYTSAAGASAKPAKEMRNAGEGLAGLEVPHHRAHSPPSSSNRAMPGAPLKAKPAMASPQSARVVLKRSSG